MQNAYVVTGSMQDGRTVVLDETLPLGPTKVRLVLEPLSSQQPYDQVMTEIRERQRLRGHQARTREQVDEELRSERDSWDEE
jgi:hypothetical protein